MKKSFFFTLSLSVFLSCLPSFLPLSLPLLVRSSVGRLVRPSVTLLSVKYGCLGTSKDSR